MIANALGVLVAEPAVIATRRLEWDMGHRVTNHASKCRNLHGHRYVALFDIAGGVSREAGASDEGMVVDFGDVKTIMGSWIDANLDHAFMVYEGDPLALTLVTTGTAVVVTPWIPTAENIAAYLLETAIARGLAVVAVTVYETPNCSARASLS